MHKKQCNAWIKEIFKLSEETKIDILETQKSHGDHIHFQTTFTIQNQGDNPNLYIIKKPLQAIFGPVFRFIAWWFAFTGLYSMFAVCPFCGQAGCVVGIGSAGVVGGFLTLMLQYGITMYSFIKNTTRKMLGLKM